MRFSLRPSVLSRNQVLARPIFTPLRCQAETSVEPKRMRKTYKVMKKVNAADDVLAERQFLHMRVSPDIILKIVFFSDCRVGQNRPSDKF